MKKRAVFLDRDGTINREMGYLSDIKKLYVFTNAARAIKLLSEAGFRIIIVSNQSGIARGLIKKKELEKINCRLQELLARGGARIDAFYICPHHPDERCSCRKPKTGLIKKAKRDFSLDLSRSYVIGDKLTDIEMGRNAGVRESILVLTGFGRGEMRRAGDTGFKLGPVCRDVLSASKLICRFESCSI